MPSDRPRRSGGARQRVCTWCPRSFTKDEHLARHIRTHTRERPFSCEICSKTFSRHDSLLRHTRSHRDISPKQRAPRPDSLTDPPLNTAFAPMRDAQTTPSTYQEGPSTLSIETEAYRFSPEKDAHHLGNHTRTHNGCPAPSPNSMSSALPSTVPLCDEQNPPGASAWLHTVTEPIQQEICDPSLSGFNTSLHSSEQSLDWASDPAAQVPFWIAADDFDLDAINSAILWSTSNFAPPVDVLGGHNEPPNRTVSSLFQSETQSREESVRRSWFTYIGDPQTGYTTPDTDIERVQVNEEYRGSLVAKLQYHSSNQPLPSTDFLNLCIQIYLTKVHPIFPIVHVPTFRPTAKSSLLLLSICSVGSLFVGSSNATAQGQRLFETLNKAILSSWENYIIHRGPESVSMIQAALIGQTYGFLSGKPKDVIVAQTFHGTLLAWARQCNMFQMKRSSTYVTIASITDNPEKAWRTWRYAEERNRIAGAIHIHDAEMSELFLTDTYLRHSVSKMPVISKDELWAAPSAQQWAKIMVSQLSTPNRDQNDTPPETPSISRSRLHGYSNGMSSNEFQGYIELEGIAASMPKGTPTSEEANSRHDLEEWLLSCHELILDPIRGTGSDMYRLRPMWHSIFISLYANIDSLELAIGRGGSEEAQSAKVEVSRWATSSDGDRCALHAMCILKAMEQTSLGCEPPMHIPRIIFRAALVWFCYTTFGSDLPDASPPNLLFPELARMGINCKQLLFEANGFSATRPRTAGSSTFCRLIDCLTRIGHWGISKRFASILSLLLPDTGGH